MDYAGREVLKKMKPEIKSNLNLDDILDELEANDTISPDTAEKIKVTICLVIVHVLFNAISFLYFICLCAFACNIVELMVGLVLIHQDNLGGS
jgi:hypothetical protein